MGDEIVELVGKEDDSDISKELQGPDDILLKSMGAGGPKS